MPKRLAKLGGFDETIGETPEAACLGLPIVAGGQPWTRIAHRVRELFRRTRLVLGRVATGAAVAALPLAALLWAASGHGRTVTGVVSAALLAVVGLVTSAPWTPVRSLLPSWRRIQRLEAFWVEGHTLQYEEIATDEAFAEWANRRLAWETRAGEWIGDHVSPVESRRFYQPGAIDVAPLSDSHGEEHVKARFLTAAQLAELLRLRDLQRAALR